MVMITYRSRTYIICFDSCSIKALGYTQVVSLLKDRYYTGNGLKGSVTEFRSFPGDFCENHPLPPKGI
jgi:hypothetical protein